MHPRKSKCSAVAEMGDRFTTKDMGQKAGGCCGPFWGIGGGKPKLLQGTSTDVKWPVIASLIITLDGKR